MTGLLIGYARVSTNDQDLTAQKNALAALGVSSEQTFTDQGVSFRSRLHRIPRKSAASADDC